MSDTISIIVPIYNACTHIPHLIESVQRQTYVHWQLILVNDGSKDNSLMVCQEYASRDERILVVDQPNAGVSVARNTGINNAIGEWITFVDADDDLLDCFLASMLEASSRGNSLDIVFTGYIIVGRNSNDIYTYEDKKYEGIEAVRNAITSTNILHRCCPWGKMFRRSIITDNNLRFDIELSHSEDRLFVYEYLIHTRGMATVSTIGYLYDSTTIVSLKNKKQETEKIVLRQKKLTEAAHKLIDEYKLIGVEPFLIVKHLILLYATAVSDYYYAMGCNAETVKLQQKFYEEYFDSELYNEIKCLPLWKRIEERNTMLQWALTGQFKRINSHLATIEKKIAVSKFVYKILHKTSVERSFEKAIHYLNRKEI